MQETWEAWTKDSASLPDEERRLVALVRDRLGPGAFENVKAELFEVERAAKEAADEPWIPVRRAIMDALDARLLNEALADLPDGLKRRLRAALGDLYADEMLLWNHLTKRLVCSILRWHSSLKYDDGAERDWLSCYSEIARDRTRRMVEELEKLASGARGGVEMRALVQRIYAENRTDPFQESLARAPRKAEVPLPPAVAAERQPDRWSW